MIYINSGFLLRGEVACVALADSIVIRNSNGRCYVEFLQNGVKIADQSSPALLDGETLKIDGLQVILKFRMT